MKAIFPRGRVVGRFDTRTLADGNSMNGEKLFDELHPHRERRI